MKRPQSLVATGIKTGGIDLGLAPLTLVTGDNGSGKTAIADALKIALLGYHPALGKKNADAFRLASGSTLEVMIPGQPWGLGPIRRTFQKKGKSISRDDSESAKEFDEKVSFPPVILDFDAFLLAKPTARREILESVLPPMDVDAIEREIDDKVAEVNIDLGIDATDFPGMIDATGEAGRSWKQEVTRLKGAVQTLEVEIAEAVEPSTEGLPEEDSTVIKARRDELLTKKGELEAQLADLQRRKDAEKPKPEFDKPSARQIADASNALITERESRKKWAETAEKHRLEDEQARGLRATIEATRQTYPGHADRPSKEKLGDDAFERSVNQLKLEEETLSTEIDDIDKKRTLAEIRLMELEEQFEGLEKADCCPTCGVKGQEFKGAVANLFETQSKALKDEIKEHEKAELERIKRRDLLTAKIAELHSDRKEWEAWEAFQTREQAQKELAALAYTRPEIPEDQTPRLQGELDQLKVHLHAWEVYEAQGEPILPEFIKSTADSLEATIQNEQTAASQLRAIDEHAKAKSAASAREGQLKATREELEGAEKNVKDAKELGDWAKTRSLEETKKRLIPLLDPANAILVDVVGGSLAIEGTDVGLQQGEVFRPIEVMSGAEATAVACALQVALATNSGLQFVILDELSRLRWERKQALVSNLRSAIENGLLGGALILDHDAKFVGSYEHEESADIGVHRVD